MQQDQEPTFTPQPRYTCPTDGEALAQQDATFFYITVHACIRVYMDA